MRKRFKVLSAVLILLLTFVLIACGIDNKNNGQEKDEKTGNNYEVKSIRVATSSPGGTYYPLGTDIADIIKEAIGVNALSITSNGSAENIKLIQKGEAEVAFTQSDIATYAKEGILMFEGKQNDKVKGLSALYPDTIQIITSKKSGINSVSDLKGKIVSIGEESSGTRTNAEQILEMYDLTLNDLKTRNLSIDDSTTGIQDGIIDAAFITAGTPTGSIEGLSSIEDIIILPIESDKIEALIEKYPYYVKDILPSGTYNLKEEIETVAVQTLLVVRNDLKEELVYEMTKAIFENTGKIDHVKGKLIKEENALDGMVIDLHPGAKKYLDEKGISAK